MIELVTEKLEQLYKTESSRLLAVLTRLFGPHNLEMAEDVLQEAFGEAYSRWQVQGLPHNPSAWLMTVAKHRAIDQIRANKIKLKFAEDLTSRLNSEWSLPQIVDDEFQDEQINDDVLRMIFMCCQPSIAPENRLPLILKTLCGFRISAISKALLIPEATIKKRIQRTRKKLKGCHFSVPCNEHLLPAMDSVHTVIYLLFNEGYYCTDGKSIIREDFCLDALALCHLLCQATKIVNQDTVALNALMNFHWARKEARMDAHQNPIPLDLQNRQLWNKKLIAEAKWSLSQIKNTYPGASGRYLEEALIAQEHCSAPVFSQTNWQCITEHYKQLVVLTESPMAKLNLAIALGYSDQIDKAIHQATALMSVPPFHETHHVHAALAHLWAMKGDADQAFLWAEKAQSSGCEGTDAKALIAQIKRKLNSFT